MFNLSKNPLRKIVGWIKRVARIHHVSTTCILFFFSSSYAYTVTDDLGNTIYLEKPAQRIISLAPDITENLFAVGAGTKIIGVLQGSDYPAEAKKISIVGSYTGIDVEKIISLHPDLIVTWSHTFNRQLETLKTFGIQVYVTQPKYLEDISHTLKNLGCLAGTEKIANAQADKYLQRLAQLKERYQTAQQVNVFYQIGSYSLITINKDSWINQAINLCGGKNIFANMPSISGEVSWEAVIIANPQIILTDATNIDWQERWHQWPQISAVKQQRLFNINPDFISRASPRLLDGVMEICQDLKK